MGTSTRAIRERVVKELGGRCNDPECKWVGLDGEHGCDDIRCLQVDHRRGNGHRSALISGNTYQHYKEMLGDLDKQEKYQVLCANCNWIKRKENREIGGGFKTII